MTGRGSGAGRRMRSGFTRVRLVSLLAPLVLLAVAIAAGPASAVVVTLHGHRFGVTPASRPRGRAFVRSHQRSPRPFDEAPGGGGPMLYHGGPVMHSSTAHVIYWDPGKEFSETTKGIVNRYFSDVAHDSGLASNVFAIANQYTDGTGNAAYRSTSAAPLSDVAAFPKSECEVPTIEADPGPYAHCLIDEQLQIHLKSFIASHKLPTGPTQLYALLLPHSVVTCFDSISEECSNNEVCAYHSSIEPGTAEEILYAAIPFSMLDTNKTFGSTFAKACQADNNEAIQQPNPDNGVKEENTETRFADVAVKYISHEYNETVTDPLGTAWFDAQFLEDGDKCNGYPIFPSEEGKPGFDKQAFTPTLGGEAAEGTLFNQAINGDHFYTQSEWDNAAKACLMMPLELTGVSFLTLPGTILTQASTAEFKGTATDPYEHPVFTWTFGDGTEGTGDTQTHTYAAPGEYLVTMSVKDTVTGSTAAPVQQKIIVDELPSASFTVEPRSHGEVKFDASASADPDGRIEKYTWSFGDGAPVQEGREVTHKYAKPGTYSVTLTVEDSSRLSATLARVIETPPDSSFAAKSAYDARSGAITLDLSVANPGTLSWLATFANGKFGVFSARAAKCKKKGFVRLARRCRPATIVYAKGSARASAAGTVAVTLKPTASARKALANARKRRKGLVVTLKLTFQSALGGAPASSTVSLTIRPKK